MMKLLSSTAMALMVVSSLAIAQTSGGSSGSTGSGSNPPTGTQGVVPGTNQPATGQVPSPGGAGPAQGATTSGSGTLGAGATMSGTYLSEQSTNHWLASNFMGKTVYGPNNERVGDVNDIVIDRTGTTTAIIVGVGGFLGMGEKNVAVPFSSIQMNTRDGRDELHMNVTRGDLEKAPAFKASRNRS